MKRQMFLNGNAKIGAQDAVKSAEQIMQEQHDKYNALLARAESAEKERDELIAERDRMREALEIIVSMNRQQASDQYGDAEVAERWACVRTARAALNGGGE